MSDKKVDIKTEHGTITMYADPAAAALALLMQRLAATESAWAAEKARADEAERGEGEAWRQVDEVRVQRDEALRERDAEHSAALANLNLVEKVERALEGALIERDEARAALAASQAREAKLRDALRGYGQHLRGCLQQSAFNDKCVCGLSAALAEEVGP